MKHEMLSFKSLIEEPIQQVFAQLMIEKIDQVTHEAHQKIDAFAEEQKQMARKKALSLTLDMCRKVNTTGITLEFKI